MDDKFNIGRRHREIIDLLLKEQVISKEILEKAREENKRTGLSIIKALEKFGISEEDIARVYAESLNIPYIDLTDYIIDVELIKFVPEDIAKKYGVIPLFKIENTLTVGMLRPQDVEVLDRIRKISQAEIIEPVLVSEQGLQKILDFYYGLSGSVQEIVDSIHLTKIEHLRTSDTMIEMAEEVPIIKLVNIMISQAVKDKASDIHIEPEAGLVRVRIRIDGILHEITQIPKKLQNAIISRIKVLAKMDIGENRRPQDGRIFLKIDNRDIDLRVSTFPTINGENVVMRLLNKENVLLGLTNIGFEPDELAAFNKIIRSPNGIILVTGPTGAGKTSTLYATINTISSIEKNIITIEDPVEYELSLIRQTQVNVKAGITFANGLRSILRQDPDIILVGEIRDKETAEVAIQAALTGHLVFSTLHTNDATTALTRLIDMGVEPFLVSSSVVGIAAQRLVRLICPNCKESYVPSDDVLKSLGFAEGTLLYRGRGCDECKKTGLKGRTSIIELLTVNEPIKKMIEQKKSSDEIKRFAISQGMKTLRDNGLAKVKSGLVTPNEVLRVTEVE